MLILLSLTTFLSYIFIIPSHNQQENTKLPACSSQIYLYLCACRYRIGYNTLPLTIYREFVITCSFPWTMIFLVLLPLHCGSLLVQISLEDRIHVTSFIYLSFPWETVVSLSSTSISRKVVGSKHGSSSGLLSNLRSSCTNICSSTHN